MWELPNVPRSATRAATASALAGRYGGSWRLIDTGTRVGHGITFRSFTLHVYRARFAAGDSVAEGPEAAWVGAEGRVRFPTSAMVEKVLRTVD